MQQMKRKGGELKVYRVNFNFLYLFVSNCLPRYFKPDILRCELLQMTKLYSRLEAQLYDMAVSKMEIVTRNQ